MAFLSVPEYTHVLRSSTTLLSLLMLMVQGSAQIANCFPVEESVRFEVKPASGISYCWKVTEKLDMKKSAETDKVIWLSSKCDSVIQLKWQKAGTYFITLSGFDQKGCSNMKVYPVIVAENHIPVAVDDYASTDWMKNIRIDLLKNDHDAGNDLDTSSLKILTNPEYGRISPGLKGEIIYVPLGNHPARDRFYYKICDLKNQCDSAIVTVDLKDPPLYLPQGISPNGDGINDCFTIGGLAAYPKSSLTIFSREGVIIFHSDDYQNDWTGLQNIPGFGNYLVPPGTYYYVLKPGLTDRVLKGFIFIAR